MKTIGMIGGMSWESTVSYYQAVNQGIKAQLGGLHSAKVCLNSVDFAQIEQLQVSGDWQQLAEILSASAQSIEKAGADFLLICTNTMHKVAPQVAQAISIPLLHIADATAQKLQSEGMTKVGLIGTRYTMEEGFYRERVQNHFGIEVIVPDKAQRDRVHDIIFQELCLGKITAASRAKYLDVIEQLANDGAQGVILGCTEIALLVQQSDTQVPLFDTTKLHCDLAVEWALK